MITNKINHKKYIGITQRTIEERWEEHIQMAYCHNHKDSKSLFKKAIRKYGKDAWIIEELDTASSIKELKEKEVYWIAKLKTYAFDEDGWGYNSTKGGDYVTEQI
jgi:group I intron endonuclease